MTGSLIFKSLVKPFYRQNASFFVFVFFIMFLAVGRANGVGLIEYHFALIRGLLTDPIFLALVLIAWTFFARNCIMFFSATIAKPSHSFLFILGQLGRLQLFCLLVLTQLLFFLPVLFYAVIVIIVGFVHHWYTSSLVVLLYNLIICVASAFWYLRLLRYQDNPNYFSGGLFSGWTKRVSYAIFLIKYLLSSRKLLFLTIKLFSCSILLFIFSNQYRSNQDWRMNILAFSLAMLGQGVLIFVVKEMENTRLDFYRGLPVTLRKRFQEYLFFILILFLPEIITILSQMSGQTFPSKEIIFIFFGFSILFLLYGLLLTSPMSMMDFLKTITIIFISIFFSAVSDTLVWLMVLFYAISTFLFFKFYYIQDV